MKHALRFALGAALLAPGCTTPAITEHTAPAVPDHWATGVTLDDAAHDWWRWVAGPRAAALVDEALAGNPDLQQWTARVGAALAELEVVDADRSPQVQAQLSRNRQRQVFVGLPIPGAGGDPLTTTSTVWNLGLGLSWELDLWGRLAAASDAAEQRGMAAVADLHGARLSLTASVLDGWLGLLEAEHLQALAEQTEELWRHDLDLARERWGGGLAGGDALAVRQLQTQVERARGARLAAERVRAAASRALERLLGRPARGELRASPQVPLPLAPPNVPSALPASLLARRPDLAAAEARLCASLSDVEVARAALYPSFTLSASVGTSSDSSSDLLDRDFRVWNLLGNLVQPVFQGGRLRARVELADARASESASRFASTLLDAVAEVEGALDSEARLVREVAAAAAAVDRAQAAADLASVRYASGTVDTSTLLATRRDVLDAQRALVTARVARLAARVGLHRALAGGWPTEETSS